MRLNIRLFFANLLFMENEQLERIEKLLRIIADELYIARNDPHRSAGKALLSWEPEREAIIEHINEVRSSLGKSK